MSRGARHTHINHIGRQVDDVDVDVDVELDLDLDLDLDGGGGGDDNFSDPVSGAQLDS